MLKPLVWFLSIFLCCENCFAQYILVGDTISPGIIYKQGTDTIVGKDSLSYGQSGHSGSIDVDGDNIPDVRFSIDWQHYSHVQYTGRSVKSLNTVQFRKQSVSTADTAAYGSVLNSSGSWCSFTDSLFLSGYSWAVPGPGYNFGAFLNGRNKYLPFRKILPYDTLYGWFKLNVPDETIITSYAYKDLYVSVNEISKRGNQLVVYPNPANDFVTIRLNSLAAQNGKITITNCLGKIICSEQELRSGKDLSFDTSSLARGVYMIEYRSQDAVIRKKITISN
ncbi:MAG: T9SS type A sorting domain-containing protein [Bacteroidia bacterium]